MVGKTTKGMTARAWTSVGICSLVLLGITTYIAYDTWIVQQSPALAFKAPGITSQRDTRYKDKANEGTDTVKPTAEMVDAFEAPSELPRLLTIDTIKLNARVQPMSLNGDRSIQAPKNIYDTGWYTGSAKPGQPGAVFIDGYASGDSREGAFAYLDTLQPGDEVRLETGDGTVLRYRVVRVDTLPVAAISMNSVLAPYSGITQGLNLMTATGRWLKDQALQDTRVIVYTQQV